MKAIVIYYSQTGNTKKIAQAIHAGMSQTVEQCDLVRIQDVNPGILGDYDLIGLGSPVINFKEPGNIRDFIEWAMGAADGKHGFVFCTHGAFAGHYMSSVVSGIAQRGLTVVGWKDWFGSVLYPAIPKPYYTDGHPDQIDLDEAKDFGREMVERSRRISLGETQLIPDFPKGNEYDAIYDPFDLRRMDLLMACKEADASTVFKLNTEKCRYPTCTHCRDICPTGKIVFSGSGPDLRMTCEAGIGNRCFLCEQTCPHGAIEIDWTIMEKAHDPLIQEWLSKILERVEARGHFRRLVQEKDIGWGNDFYKTKKPPRFKIDY